MPGYRLPRALPSIVMAACVSTASHSGQAGAAASRRDCGFEAAQRDYLDRISEGDANSEERRRPPACRPPDAEEIASACETEEAVSAAVEAPSDPPDLHRPDYRVRRARCRLVGRDRSDAYCRFELGEAGAAPAWRKVRMRFRYRYGIVSDDMGHPLGYAMWHSSGVCAAGEAPAAP